MTARALALLLVIPCVYRVGCDCGGPVGTPCEEPGEDAGIDGGADAGTDVGLDSGTSAGADGGPAADSGFDAGSDAGLDAGLPPIDGLKDDFDAGVIEPWWVVNMDPDASVGLSNGELALAPAPNASGLNQAFVYTAGTFDFTNRAVSVEVTRMVVGPSAFAWFSLNANNPDQDRVELIVEGSTLYSRYWLDGGLHDNAPVTYDAVQHRYWRLRESAGVSYWETSADGGSFVIRYQRATPLFETNDIGITLGAGTTGPEAAPGETDFDDLNILP
jgi:hypothetical protein